MTITFDINCRACPRLAQFLDQVHDAHPHYYTRPVPPFGDACAWLLIVGLAPGMHGANRSGRPFTGDHAGILLYRTLHQFSFSNREKSVAVDDGLILTGCRITNAVKCLPPHNKPDTGEVKQCNLYLAAELATLPPQAAVLALGAVAHKAVLLALQVSGKHAPFAHGRVHNLAAGMRLYDSYHCSRYNTQTRRLTADMFAAVFARIRQDHPSHENV